VLPDRSSTEGRPFGSNRGVARSPGTSHLATGLGGSDETRGHGRDHGDRASAVVFGDMNLVRCLVDRQVPLLFLSSDPEEATLRSRHCRDREIVAPPSNVEAALRDLERIGKTFAVRPVLYYGNDALLLLISRHRERLARYYRFRMPSRELVEQLTNKRLFAELSERIGLCTPKTANSRDVDSADAILERVPLPCALKPNVHIDWFEFKSLHTEGPKKALRANTPDELRAMYESLLRFTDDFVVQQFIEGDEDQIYSFHAYLAASGQPLGYYVGKKIRTFPKQAGISTYLELVHDRQVVDLGLDVLRRLNFTGPVKIDMKKDARSGEFYILELNARFNLWHYLGTVCGINLPELAYADLTVNAQRGPSDYRTGVKWLSFGNDFRSFLRSYRPSGELGWSDYLRSFAGSKVYDVFSWNDPAPFAATVTKYMKALGQRTFDSLVIP
jgi:predicted ATP-grasp superfamily ATP-dependent carboligase